MIQKDSILGQTFFLMASSSCSMPRCAACNAYGLTAFLPGKGRLVDE